MSAVASAPADHGGDEADSRMSTEQSPSRFTAVNGREPSGPAVNGTSESHPAASSYNHEHRTSPGHPTRIADLNNHAPETHERPMPGAAAGSPARNGDDGRRLSADRSSANDNQNKRKRSISADRQVAPPESYHHAQSVSRSPVSRPAENMAARESLPVHPQVVDANGDEAHRASTVESDPMTKAPPSSKYGLTDRADLAGSDSNSSTRESYNAHLSTHAHQLPQNMDSSDVRLAEALQRDVQGTPAAEHSNRSTERQSNELSDAQQSPQADHRNTPEESQPPSTQSQTKRRRVFSNRTKTGCLTCRRRKKKCDEHHPTCNNCERGGFACEGYAARRAWPKISASKPPIPLQSKEPYHDTTNHYAPDVASHVHHDFRGPPSAIHSDGSKTRPLSVDHSERSLAQYITSPGGRSQTTWGKSSWPPPGPSSFAPAPQTNNDSREGAPLNGLSRAEQTKPDYAPFPNNVRDLSHGPHGKPGMGVFQSNVDQRSTYPTHVDAASYSAQARSALSLEQHIPPKTTLKSEKEKMLSGEEYLPFDPELVKDRDRCKAALWQFTNAGNPLSGISADEKVGLLKRVLMPPTDPSSNGVTTYRQPPTGSLKPGAVVETPFNCRYGYNIHLGEDVYISENCFFADDCNISIGAHTWIGPNVKILTSMAVSDLQARKGSKSPYQGQPVVIEQDCWIGPGSTIMPGVTIGRGGRIGSGDMVQAEVRQYDWHGMMPKYR